MRDAAIHIVQSLKVNVNKEVRTQENFDPHGNAQNGQLKVEDVQPEVVVKATGLPKHAKDVKVSDSKQKTPLTQVEEKVVMKKEGEKPNVKKTEEKPDVKKEEPKPEKSNVDEGNQVDTNVDEKLCKKGNELGELCCVCVCVCLFVCLFGWVWVLSG